MGAFVVDDLRIFNDLGMAIGAGRTGRTIVAVIGLIDAAIAGICAAVKATTSVAGDSGHDCEHADTVVSSTSTSPAVASDASARARRTASPHAPNVNGAADPAVADDEDPTQILIQSAPYFDVDKVSTYLDGDPSVLDAWHANCRVRWS